MLKNIERDQTFLRCLSSQLCSPETLCPSVPPCQGSLPTF